MPFDYALWKFAIRVGIPPWLMTVPLPPDADAERLSWIERGLWFMEAEAGVRAMHD